MNIAKVYIEIQHSDLDQAFDYLIPPNLPVEAGMEVEVPFGTTFLIGFVVDITHFTLIAEEKLRPISSILHGGEKLLNSEQLRLARDLAEHYRYPLIAVLNTMVPGGLRGYRRSVSINRVEVLRLNPEADSSSVSPHAKVQLKILKILENGPKTWKQLAQESGAKNRSSLDRLLEKKHVLREYREELRKPLVRSLEPQKTNYSLNSAQKKIANDLQELLQRKQFAEVLIHGVTGSGKTDVYLEAVKTCLANNRQVIYLVPEIALIAQTVQRLKEYFSSRIAILHSHLSLGEKYDEWRRIFLGQADIVVGPRSAIFAPLSDVGLIIIDEEQEGGYKQDSGWRYHASEVACIRGRSADSLVIYGSATPSVTTYYRAEQGEIYKFSLSDRVKDLPLPTFELIDMREEMRRRNFSLLSTRLHAETDKELQLGNKVILLLNRRGAEHSFVCRDCGSRRLCPHCDISLTYHRDKKSFLCHYCNYQEEFSSVCPLCGGELISFGFGIQAAESELRKRFPNTPIIRLDSDVAQYKNAHLNILEKFRHSPPAILLGTQMVAKGLNLERVNLVGVINADTGLSVPDYTAEERTFQLLTQVAGRAGRMDEPGRVLVQTFSPDSEVIQLGCEQNYEKFYRREIEYRKHLRYPPFSYFVRILALHEDEKAAYRAVRFIAEQLKGFFSSGDILGPAPAPLRRIRGRYRYHIIIKASCNPEERERQKDEIHAAIYLLRSRAATMENPPVIIMDLDPETVL